MQKSSVIDAMALKNEKKIVLLILDGVGDINSKHFAWRTPLEAASTPNLDRLAAEGVTGRMHPIVPGITPGSGPGHLGLFGYDPLQWEIGRGVLEAVGLGMELLPGDLAARANFATQQDGLITDRRAGRVPTEETARLCEKLRKIDHIDDVEVIIKPGLGHRFVVLFRGKDLGANLTDTDPQRTGQPIKECLATAPDSERSATLVNRFVETALPLLADEPRANAFLMRGLAGKPNIPSMSERFKLTPGCIAVYPMYRGLASLVGMDLIPTGTTIDDEFATARERWADYDFFFIHVKGTDSAGEDGNFEGKVEVLEQVDRALPALLDLQPDVLAVTGDHSTPAPLKAHSWHPVPVLIHGEFCGQDQVAAFTENNCNQGGLGFFTSKELMGLLLANALKLDKYGA
jgi:2,3-bisphosphoglycerate-independent phosphoglycerate mutase